MPALEVHEGLLGCNYCPQIIAGKDSAVSNMKNHLRKHSIFAPPERLSHKSSVAWWSQHWRVTLSQQFFTRTKAEGTNATILFEVHKPFDESTSSEESSKLDDTSNNGGYSNAKPIDPLLTTVERLHA